MALQEFAPAEAGDEAQVLALALVRNGQPGVARKGTDRLLREAPEREREPVEQARVEPGQHVALVLERIRRRPDQWAAAVPRDACVVPGREARRTEGVRQREHLIEAHLAVAAHARVGGAAGRVAVEEVVDHLGAEALPHVEGHVRDAHAVGEPPRAEHRLRRAAALFAVGCRVGPQLERDRHDLVPGVQRQLGRRCAVNSPAHRDERAPRAVAEPRPARTRHGAERAVQSVGRELCGVPLRRHETTERGHNVLRPHSRYLEEGPALDQLDHSASRGDQRATALGVEARLDDTLALHAYGHAHEVAARRAAGDARVGRIGEHASTRGQVEMVNEGAHRAKPTGRGWLIRRPGATSWHAASSGASLERGPSLRASRPYTLSRTPPGRESHSR